MPAVVCSHVEVMLPESGGVENEQVRETQGLLLCRCEEYSVNKHFFTTINSALARDLCIYQ